MARKKIYFDGLNLGLKRGTGVATYTRVLAGLTRDMGHETGILYSLRRNLPSRQIEREVAFFDDPPEIALPRGLRALASLGGYASAMTGVRPQKLSREGIVITRPFRDSWVESDDVFAARRIFDRARGLFVLSDRLLRVRFDEPPDLFHWTYPLPIAANARANIYTVHDLVPIRLPYTTLDWKRYYIAAMRKILAKADHVVTVSENSKRDIMTTFGVEERRITNTYQAVNIPRAYLDRAPDTIADELAGIFGLEMKNYFLFYGSFEPKKNIGRIVQAYLASKVDIPLVIVVAQSWQNDEESRLLDQVLEEDRLNKRKRIRRYEYLPFALLISLIQGARALVFPSLYEGFGLPVLEAMTLGTPVITSNTSSTPEIAGDAALTVDPYDVGAIRDAIAALGRDKDLCAELSMKGAARAQAFSLEAYGRTMAALYDSLS
ncbi:MAG TPA: glycosyltransferase family 1 protein [Rhizomicrobium sp.]